jgi:zinc protease
MRSKLPARSWAALAAAAGVLLASGVAALFALDASPARAHDLAGLHSHTSAGAPASASASLPAPAPPISRLTLPNGLRVILVEDHSKPLVGICLFVDGGSRTEPPDLSGLSHYYEHLIFRGGSARQAELDFRRQMQRIGEESGGYTTNDYTCYGFTAPTQQLDEALWRSADAWMNLKLTQTKVSRERQVVMEEYNQGEDRPDYQVYYQTERLMFQEHPYKRSTIGRKEVIQGASLATFRTFYEDRYVPNQMVLAAVGDFDAEVMAAKLAKAFSPYRRGAQSFELGLTEPPQTAFRMAIKNMKTPNTWTYLGFHVPAYSDPDAPALTVLASLLGQGRSSRLYRALKERENLVTEIYADFEVRKDPGMFLIGAELPPQNEARVFGIVRDEIRKLAEKPATADELERVKSSLLSSYAFATQTFFSRAERLCLFEIMSDASVERLWPSLVQGVTAEDVRRVAARYLDADQASYSVVRPKEEAGPSQAEIEAMLPAWRQGWPAGGQTRATASAPARRETLPNGITLILKEDHATPIVGVEAIARGGQWIEPEALAGVSNMAAELLARGAGSMTAQQISDRAGNLGMRFASGGSADYASISMQSPASNFDKAWDLYKEMLLRPTFPSDQVAKVREDLVREVQSLGDRPFEYTNVQFAKAIYTKSPYRRPVTGDEASLAKIQAKDLRRAYETMFCGANLVIAVAGDFDSNRFLETARRTLGSMRRGSAVTVGNITDEPPAEAKVIFDRKEQEQVTYNTGWLGCSIRDPDYVPLRVVTSLIGTKLFFEYVYEKGVAYRSWFYRSDRMGQASLQNEMGVTPANFPATSGEVLEDISAAALKPLTPADVKNAIDMTLTRFYLGAQEASEVAQRLGYYEAAGLGFEYAERYPELLRQVTAEQATAVAKKYIRPGAYTRVAVGEEPAKGTGAAAAPKR